MNRIIFTPKGEELIHSFQNARPAPDKLHPLKKTPLPRKLQASSTLLLEVEKELGDQASSMLTRRASQQVQKAKAKKGSLSGQQLAGLKVRLQMTYYRWLNYESEHRSIERKIKAIVQQRQNQDKSNNFSLDKSMFHYQRHETGYRRRKQNRIKKRLIVKFDPYFSRYYVPKVTHSFFEKIKR